MAGDSNSVSGSGGKDMVACCRSLLLAVRLAGSAAEEEDALYVQHATRDFLVQLTQGSWESQRILEILQGLQAR